MQSFLEDNYNEENEILPEEGYKSKQTDRIFRWQEILRPEADMAAS